MASLGSPKPFNPSRVYLGGLSSTPDLLQVFMGILVHHHQGVLSERGNLENTCLRLHTTYHTLSPLPIFQLLYQCRIISWRRFRKYNPLFYRLPVEWIKLKKTFQILINKCRLLHQVVSRHLLMAVIQERSAHQQLFL